MSKISLNHKKLQSIVNKMIKQNELNSAIKCLQYQLQVLEGASGENNGIDRIQYYSHLAKCHLHDDRFIEAISTSTMGIDEAPSLNQLEYQNTSNIAINKNIINCYLYRAKALHEMGLDIHAYSDILTAQDIANHTNTTSFHSNKKLLSLKYSIELANRNRSNENTSTGYHDIKGDGSSDLMNGNEDAEINDEKNAIIEYALSSYDNIKISKQLITKLITDFSTRSSQTPIDTKQLSANENYDTFQSIIDGNNPYFNQISSLAQLSGYGDIFNSLMLVCRNLYKLYILLKDNLAFVSIYITLLWFYIFK
jgi:hypothetical protein